MFDIGWSELLLVLVVALVVVGPKDLPRLMRLIGKWVGKARHMADQFRASFDELARETELDELRREIAALRYHNPVTRFQEEINRSIQPPAVSGAPARLPAAEGSEVSDAPPHDEIGHPAQLAPDPAPLEPGSATHAGSEGGEANGLEPLPPGYPPTGP